MGDDVGCTEIVGDTVGLGVGNFVGRGVGALVGTLVGSQISIRLHAILGNFPKQHSSLVVNKCISGCISHSCGYIPELVHEYNLVVLKCHIVCTEEQSYSVGDHVGYSVLGDRLGWGVVGTESYSKWTVRVRQV